MTKEEEYTFKDGEHIAGFHTTFQEGCHQCWAEDLRVKRSNEEYNKMMKNPHGSNYPAGYRPE